MGGEHGGAGGGSKDRARAIQGRSRVGAPSGGGGRRGGAGGRRRQGAPIRQKESAPKARSKNQRKEVGNGGKEMRMKWGSGRQPGVGGEEISPGVEGEGIWPGVEVKCNQEPGATGGVFLLLLL